MKKFLIAHSKAYLNEKILGYSYSPKSGLTEEMLEQAAGLAKKRETK